MLKRLYELFTKFDCTKVQTEWEVFYRAFEDRFRGSCEHIETLLSTRYQDLLTNHLKTLPTPHYAIDLGCGRGEMLKLLAGLGCQTLGVDSSDKMFGNFSNLPQISLKKSDIAKFLQTHPADSVHVITLMHVLEHCPFDYTFVLLKECFRVLKPDGVLLLETPSLRSLWAASRQFYLDPTHKTPLHPEYMQFLVNYLGFRSSQILEYSPPNEQECAKIASKTTDPSLAGEFNKLEKWLYGPMDLSIWATK